MPCLNDKNILSLNLHLCSQIKFNVCQYKIFPNTTFYFNDPKPTTSMLHKFLCLGIPSVFCQIHCSLENVWRKDAGRYFNLYIHTPPNLRNSNSLQGPSQVRTEYTYSIYTGETTSNPNSNTPKPDQPHHY